MHRPTSARCSQICSSFVVPVPCSRSHHLAHVYGTRVGSNGYLILTRGRIPNVELLDKMGVGIPGAKQGLTSPNRAFAPWQYCSRYATYRKTNWMLKQRESYDAILRLVAMSTDYRKASCLLMNVSNLVLKTVRISYIYIYIIYKKS